LTRKNRPRNDL